MTHEVPADGDHGSLASPHSLPGLPRACLAACACLRVGTACTHGPIRCCGARAAGAVNNALHIAKTDAGLMLYACNNDLTIKVGAGYCWGTGSACSPARSFPCGVQQSLESPAACCNSAGRAPRHTNSQVFVLGESLVSRATIRNPVPVNYCALSPDGRRLSAVGDCENTMVYAVRESGAVVVFVWWSRRGRLAGRRMHAAAACHGYVHLRARLGMPRTLLVHGPGAAATLHAAVLQLLRARCEPLLGCAACAAGYGMPALSARPEC
jgi:hypothetical protein